MEERAQQADQLAAGAGLLLGALLGGRRRTRSMAGALGRSARGAGKRRAAEAKVVDATDDLLEIERDIEASILDIDARWRAVAIRSSRSPCAPKPPTSPSSGSR